MQLLDSQMDAMSLSDLGAEAISFLCSRDFRTLADRFGYALAFDRDAAKAIEEDLAECLAESRGEVFASRDMRPLATVTFFDPNTTGLFAVVECALPTDDAPGLLVELVVTARGGHKHLTLEQISVAV